MGEVFLVLDEMVYRLLQPDTFFYTSIVYKAEGAENGLYQFGQDFNRRLCSKCSNIHCDDQRVLW
jgi:hypothetical protein